MVSKDADFTKQSAIRRKKMKKIILFSIIVLAFSLSATVTMAEVNAGTGSAENCKDGIDNNMDGRIDCADPDCAKDSSCLVALNIKHSGSTGSSRPSSCMNCHEHQKGSDAQKRVHLQGPTGGAPCISW